MKKKEKRRKFSFLVTALAGSSVPHLIDSLARHSIDYRYTMRIAITFMVTVLLEPFRWWEEIRWKRKISRVHFKQPPVFIIGFWRSGTTMLHNLLCQDPMAAYVTTYQTVFPNHILSHSWWFKPIIGQFWPTHRPMDDVKMGMDLPQEEEIALASLQMVSFYNFLYYPKDFDAFYHKELFLEELSDKKINHWGHEYLKLIRKSILNTKGERFISKNPSNMARISHLLKMFPDARFIYIYRNPYKAAESFYRFFQEILPVVQIQDAKDSLTREKFIQVYADMNKRYFYERHLIPPQNLIELRFEDFIGSPSEHLRNIYDQFQLPGFNEALPKFEEQLKDLAGFKQSRYEIIPQTVDWINENAADIMEKLGYDIERRA